MLQAWWFSLESFPVFDQGQLAYYITDLAWSSLGVKPAELSEVAEKSVVFRNLLGLLTPQPFREKKRYENEWIKKNSF